LLRSLRELNADRQKYISAMEKSAQSNAVSMIIELIEGRKV